MAELKILIHLGKHLNIGEFFEFSYRRSPL